MGGIENIIWMDIKNKLNRIRQSKDSKVLVENFAYLSLLQIAGYVFPLITMPYLARVIGVEGFGKIAFASGIITWIQTIADWGFNYTATRDVAKNRDDKKKVSEIFSNVLWSRCLLMLCSFLILLLLVMVIPQFRANSTVILVTFLMVPGHIMFPDWFFQAMERMKYITWLNLLSKSLFTLAVFLFVKEKDDYVLQPLFVSLGFILSGVVALYYILFRWQVKLLRPSLSALKVTIGKSTDVFINDLMPNLYNSFSTILLGFWGGSISNGKLEAGNRFVSIGRQFMQIITRVFFPFLSRKIEHHHAYAVLNLCIGGLGTLFLFLCAPWLIKLFFTSEFNDSIVVLRICSFAILFSALNSAYGVNFMITRGFDRQLRNITIVVSIIGFVISFPLVYYFDYVGAALTITSSQAMLGIATMLKVYSIKKQITNK